MNAGARDPRNLLVMPIIEVARSLSPRVIVVENVPAFLTRQIPHPETMYATTAAALLAEVLTENYAVFPFLCDLADFGIPQHRKRAFLTFVRRDLWGLQDFVRKRRAPYPKPSYCSKEGGMEHISVEDCLEALSLAKLDARNRRTASSADPLHTVPVWSKHHYSMVAAIPAGSGSSAWENEVCEICGTVNVREDDFKCPNCGNRLLRPVVQESDGSLRLVRGFRATSYRRMNPKTPAPAVTTANGTIGSSTTIHPDQNRVLSARECCHLQTIPDDFLWLKSGDDHIETHVVRKMIGEAVPPKFTELHGKAIRGILEEKHVLAPISVFDDRCETARRKMIKSQFPNLA